MRTNREGGSTTWAGPGSGTRRSVRQARKWGGFRSILFRDGTEVELGNRKERPMTRYFPELAAAALSELPPN